MPEFRSIKELQDYLTKNPSGLAKHVKGTVTRKCAVCNIPQVMDVSGGQAVCRVCGTKHNVTVEIENEI